MSNTKHFGKGSRKPNTPLDGRLRFYSMRFCPYAQRVQLALHAKGIPHNTININITEKPEWFLDMNPNGKVPALHLVTDHGQPFITESLIIMEYLDEKFPQYPLYPRDPLYKAIDKMWIERFTHVTAAFFRLVVEPRDADRCLLEISDALDLYDDELRRRCTPFFGGKRPNMLDYAIWPWFERTELVKTLVGGKFSFDRKRYPTLAEWYPLMLNDHAIKKCYLPEEVHVKFLESRHSGSPNYDILV